jgi:hypothetical protein
MSRESEIIARIVSDLQSEGVIERNVRMSSNDYDYNSYQDFMVDRRLSGLPDLTNQEIWEHQKQIINKIKGQLLKLTDDYSKLDRKYNNLLRDLQEIEIEKRSK